MNDCLLDIITEYIKSSQIIYANPNRDGRINSSLNEDQIIQYLPKLFSTNEYLIQNKFKIKIPNMREWYDFGIIKTDDDDFFIPINIKVTKLGTDNLNCKLGIYFSLTGLLPSNLSNEIGWREFFSELHSNINTYTDKDYYFIVANKHDNTDCFWNSLKRLPTLTSNGNNLPFQTNWSRNRIRQNRTHNQAGYFILQCFKESVYKRAEIRDFFQQYIESDLNNYKNGE